MNEPTNGDGYPCRIACDYADEPTSAQCDECRGIVRPPVCRCAAVAGEHDIGCPCWEGP
jgi:hypothetical protein